MTSAEALGRAMGAMLRDAIEDELRTYALTKDEAATARRSALAYLIELLGAEP